METEFTSCVCRICLSKGQEMQDLFDETSVVEQIEYCTGLLLSPDPGLPEYICRLCLSHLRTAHTFKSVCLASHHSLHLLIHSQLPSVTDSSVTTLVPDPGNVKVEIDDGEVDDGLDVDDDWVDEVKRSKRIKLKKEKEDGSVDTKPAKAFTRGPYKKGGARRPKFKFRRLYCSLCQLRFGSKAESDAHHAAAHADRDPEPWMCEVCGKVFAHRGSHYTHVRSHAAPRHACAHCDYRTWHRHDLLKHLRIHSGVKQYECSVCRRSFRTVSNLRSHARRLHERARPHACPTCARRFFDATKLRRHMDCHQDIKRFECEVCHSSFTRRCYWKKHLLKQHNVAVPPQRPGRQRLNYRVGEQLLQGDPGDPGDRGDRGDPGDPGDTATQVGD